MSVSRSGRNRGCPSGKSHAQNESPDGGQRGRSRTGRKTVAGFLDRHTGETLVRYFCKLQLGAEVRTQVIPPPGVILFLVKSATGRFLAAFVAGLLGSLMIFAPKERQSGKSRDPATRRQRHQQKGRYQQHGSGERTHKGAGIARPGRIFNSGRERPGGMAGAWALVPGTSGLLRWLTIPNVVAAIRPSWRERRNQNPGRVAVLRKLAPACKPHSVPLEEGCF